MHAVEHAPVHRLQPVAHVRQGARDDDRHRVVEEARAHLLLELARLDPARAERPGRRPQTSRTFTSRRVLLDEEAARLDLVAHQHREELVGGVRVLDVDPHHQPLRRIHRRLPQLLGVHLAEALEARELDADLLREVERRGAQLGERLRLGRLLAERERERRRADDLDEPRVRLAQVRVDRRREQVGGERDALCRRRLLLDHLHLHAVGVVLEHRQRVPVRRQARRAPARRPPA